MKFNLRLMFATSVAVVFLVAGVAAQGQGQNAKKEAPPKRIAIRAGRLIDGKSDSAIQNAVIVIEGDKIVSVAVAGAVPAGVETIDLSHATVMPGFADVHTHVVLNGDITAEDYDAQLLKQSIPYRAILGARNAYAATDRAMTSHRAFRDARRADR